MSPSHSHVWPQTPIHSEPSAASSQKIGEELQANGVEPHAYLTHLFTHLPSASTVEHFEALLPWNVKNSIH